MLNKYSESTGRKLQALSSFAISAGSAHGDTSVSAYVYAYLESKGLVKPSFEGCAEIKDNFSYEEIVPVFNEPAEAILKTFIEMYFKHIPSPIGNVSDYRECLKDGIERLSA